MENEWIDLGNYSKEAKDILQNMKVISRKLNLSKDKVKKLNRSIDMLDQFRCDAENEMYKGNKGNTNVFYGDSKNAGGKHSLDRFSDECISVDVNGMLKAREFYSLYVKWCDINNLKEVTETMFGREMTKRYVKKRSGGILYKGIKVDVS